MNNININEFFGDYTLLHYACEKRINNLVMGLVNKGADINLITSNTRMTPLQLYLSSEDNSFPCPTVTRVLCSKGNINSIDIRDHTALFYAVNGWWHTDLYPEIIGMLLDYGADPNIYPREIGSIMVDYCTNNFKEGFRNNVIYYNVAVTLLERCSRSTLAKKNIKGKCLREIAVSNQDIQLYSFLNFSLRGFN